MYPRLKAICDKEGFKLDEITLKKIIESTNGDMRQCLNLLMLWSVNGQNVNPSNIKDLYDSFIARLASNILTL